MRWNTEPRTINERKGPGIHRGLFSLATSADVRHAKIFRWRRGNWLAHAVIGKPNEPNLGT